MVNKILNTVIAFIITLIFLLPYLALKQVETDREMQRNKYIASQKINDISQKLIEELNISFEYVEVLDIIVKNNPNDPDIIKTYSEMILKKHDILQNIAVAPVLSDTLSSPPTTHYFRHFPKENNRIFSPRHALKTSYNTLSLPQQSQENSWFC